MVEDECQRYHKLHRHMGYVFVTRGCLWSVLFWLGWFGDLGRGQGTPMGNKKVTHDGVGGGGI